MIRFLKLLYSTFYLLYTILTCLLLFSTRYGLTIEYTKEYDLHRLPQLLTKSSSDYHSADQSYASLLSSIPVDIDCSMRAFTVEYAAYLQPAGNKSDWAQLVADALQMQTHCNQSHTYNDIQARDNRAATRNIHSINSRLNPIIQSRENRFTSLICDVEYFVDCQLGNDKSNSSGLNISTPLKTIQKAVRMTRLRPTTRIRACITIRHSICYLGQRETTTMTLPSEKIAIIALTSVDSNLTISSYNGEKVIFSGGTLLSDLKWSNSSFNPNVSQALIPELLNVNTEKKYFNELYTLDTRAITAKYPNSDPSFSGLYSSSTGWLNSAASWISPLPALSATEIHFSSPSITHSYFPNHQYAVGGQASYFIPPASFWALSNPPAGGGATFTLPRGLKWGTDFSPRVANYSDPSTGLIHAIQGEHWGSWLTHPQTNNLSIFQISSLNVSTSSIIFGEGGYQESRGASSGSEYYISNILEELDYPFEWHIDRNTNILYFMPNFTNNSTTPPPLIASQVNCLISIYGSSTQPATDITINGIQFSHTSNNFFGSYEVPSAGDWSISRVGSIVLQGTEYVSILNSSFTLLGSNAVVISQYNLSPYIAYNEFINIGASAVIVAGRGQGIDTVSIANTNYPLKTIIYNNICANIGVYLKEVSCIFHALSKSSIYERNVQFNMPRAAINMNDGMGGDTVASYNLFANTVRETGDHGPWNSWDRNPYLTRSSLTGSISLKPDFNSNHHNLFYPSLYYATKPLDHDDGSSYYNDSSNVMIFGSIKNQLGHDQNDFNELMIYPDLTNWFGEYSCYSDDRPIYPITGFNMTMSKSTCIIYQQTALYALLAPSCTLTSNLSAPQPQLHVPTFNDNTFYMSPQQAANAIIPCTNINGSSMNVKFSDWQKELGLDEGSVLINQLPTTEQIVEWMREILMD